MVSLQDAARNARLPWLSTATFKLEFGRHAGQQHRKKVLACPVGTLDDICRSVPDIIGPEWRVTPYGFRCAERVWDGKASRLLVFYNLRAVSLEDCHLAALAAASVTQWGDWCHRDSAIALRNQIPDRLWFHQPLARLLKAYGLHPK